jgi:hypothetical protein
VSESVTIDRSAFVGSGRSLRTAGLQPEGWYLFEIVNARPKTFSGTSQRTGEPYTVNLISFQLRAHKVAVYAADGTGKGIFSGTEDLDPKPTFFKDMNIATKGLQTLGSAYKAVTGRLPSADQVDYLAMAEELRGSKVWGSIFWAENEETGEIRETVKNTFRSVDQGPVGSVVLRNQED